MADRIDQSSENTISPLETANERIRELEAIKAKLEARIAELERSQETDKLTGLYNDKGFYKNAERYHEHAVRNKEPYAIAYLDLDNFKAVNDKVGHSEADKILKVVAEAIKKTIRAEDLAARFHGDEFGVLLPNFDLKGQNEWVERLKMSILKELAITYPGATEEDAIKRNVSATIGVYLWNGEKNWDQVLDAADTAMSANKQRGVR